uniref:BPTI/Kunitz inhibitor domain-containing protein n=1 Tax=Romanomermis culicivorax TaxID=13658 RepID=A0A915K2D1_ROMCU
MKGSANLENLKVVNTDITQSDLLFIFVEFLVFSAVELCTLPHVIGTGSYRIPRWYFNDQTNKCELFYYSGCCGNANNFPSYDSCRRLCELDPCNQPTDCGFGSSKINRFGYNKTSKICQPFGYNGNGGNKNNFVSMKECKKTCNTKISLTEEVVNPCIRGRPTRLSRTGEIRCGRYEASYGYCPINYYCHVGSGSASTVCCPRPKDLAQKCDQPLITGQGAESLTRWHYNQSINKCKAFQYKGYRGNENNFLSESTCNRDCQVKNICFPEDDSSTTLKQTCSQHEQCPNGYFCLFGSGSRTTACCPK